jgi:hypothetical protein
MRTIVLLGRTAGIVGLLSDNGARDDEARAAGGGPGFAVADLAKD